jgi:endonuclease YncB( thermonuclease family)
MRRTLAIITALISSLSPAGAESTASWFPPPPTAVYQTGDSWSDHGVTYRLYGVQSCLRGTNFTNAHGLKRDCGEASLAMLIALTRDLRPQCYEAMSLPQAKTIFVFCIAQPTQGAAAGSRIDLGTALISTGYAFAALRPDGAPVHAPYLIAQTVAAKSHAGLWAFPDLPEPNAIILQALRAGAAAVAAAPGAPATASNAAGPPR